MVVIGAHQRRYEVEGLSPVGVVWWWLLVQAGQNRPVSKPASGQRVGKRSRGGSGGTDAPPPLDILSSRSSTTGSVARQRGSMALVSLVSYSPADTTARVWLYDVRGHRGGSSTVGRWSVDR